MPFNFCHFAAVGVELIIIDKLIILAFNKRLQKLIFLRIFEAKFNYIIRVINLKLKYLEIELKVSTIATFGK